MRKLKIAAILAMAALAAALGPVGAGVAGAAPPPPQFNMDPVNKVMTLLANGTTAQTIVIPDGWTLDGAGYTITAVDPTGGHFLGAVVRNGGATANVRDVTITASGLVNACDAGANRLRGILFEGASGSITGSRIVNINQGLSGCQEGNGIEVRNAPFDGTHPNTRTVTISNNHVDRYQKTGIVVNGDVQADVTNNFVGSAGLPKHIAANSIQIGFGASAGVNNNTIVGNQWDKVTIPQWAATAVLVYYAGDVNVNHNRISGDGTDVGIDAEGSGTVNVMNNVIQRVLLAVDTIDAYGIGVGFWGNQGKSKLVRNSLSGWKVAYEGPDLARVNAVDP